MQQGYFLTSGAKFGGTFLAYPADPLRFHAHFIVIVKLADALLHPLDIVASGRLGVTVKKSTVIATVIGDAVSYITVDWQGVT